MEYIVSKGYDYEDFESVGLNRATKFIMFLAQKAPDDVNLNYLMHVGAFTKNNMEKFSMGQLQRMITSL